MKGYRKPRTCYPGPFRLILLAMTDRTAPRLQSPRPCPNLCGHASATARIQRRDICGSLQLRIRKHIEIRLPSLVHSKLSPICDTANLVLTFCTWIATRSDEDVYWK
jgi:hypothetical protein